MLRATSFSLLIFVGSVTQLSIFSRDAVETVTPRRINLTEPIVVKDKMALLQRAQTQDAWHGCDEYGLHVLETGNFQTSAADRINFAPTSYKLLFCDHLDANPLFLRLPFGERQHMDFRLIWNDDLTPNDLFVPTDSNSKQPVGYGLRVMVSTFLAQTNHPVHLLFSTLENLNSFVLAAQGGLGTLKVGLDHELLHIHERDFLQAHKIIISTGDLIKRKARKVPITMRYKKHKSSINKSEEE